MLSDAFPPARDRQPSDRSERFQPLSLTISRFFLALLIAFSVISFASVASAAEPQANASNTGSTAAATAKPTARCTSSLSAGCATASAPAHTPSAEPQKARLSAKSCAASSATSRVRSSTPSVPPRPHHVAATDGLDHDHARQPRLRNQPNPHLTPIGTSQVRSTVPTCQGEVRDRGASPEHPDRNGQAVPRKGVMCGFSAWFWENHSDVAVRGDI